MQLQGRRLDDERLYFGQNVVHRVEGAEWDRLTIGYKAAPVLTPATVGKWVCMYPVNKQQTANRFVNELLNIGKRLGTCAILRILSKTIRNNMSHRIALLPRK